MDGSVRFPESALAHELLDGLTGIEIGGAAHNAFGLDTWNVDQIIVGHEHHETYASLQRHMCGDVMGIDVCAPGDSLPFADDSLDFVLSSHVIEHFYDPISALAEWARVSRRYIFLICPQRDAFPGDADRPLTSLNEHRARHRELAEHRITSDEHHSRWTAQSFHAMCEALGYHVTHMEDPDEKVGNGFTIVIDLQANPWTMAAKKYRRKSKTALTLLRRRVRR